MLDLILGWNLIITEQNSGENLLKPMFDMMQQNILYLLQKMLTHWPLKDGFWKVLYKCVFKLILQIDILSAAVLQMRRSEKNDIKVCEISLTA